MWIIRFSVSLETQSSKVCIKPEETVDLSTPLRFVEKHFQEGSAELQIPPLRFASVGMTKVRTELPSERLVSGWKETAGPSTTLGFGRDDNSVGKDKRTGKAVSMEGSPSPLSSRPERSVVEGSVFFDLTQTLKAVPQPRFSWPGRLGSGPGSSLLC
jgi:hypothetical protein